MMAIVEQLLLRSKQIRKWLFYLQYLPAALSYSLKRDRFERRYLPKSSTSATQPGKLLQAKAIDRGAYFHFEQAELEIHFLAPDLVRVTWLPGVLPVPYGIARQEWNPVVTRLERKNSDWTIASESLSIQVSTEGCLTFYNPVGQILRTELPPQRQGEQWQHEAPLQPEEHIYGLGERAAFLNLRSAKNQLQRPSYCMWNSDPGGRYAPGTDPLYICIPVYLGLHNAGSYLIFYENSFRAEFAFGDKAIAHFDGGSLRYYITTGEPAHLLERYTELTGRASLPPRWALGYHQSRWGYRNAQTIRQEVEDFQAHDLPLNAIHLDIDCQAGHRPFTIDPRRFPNLVSFMQELKTMGVRFVAINNPGVKRTYHSNLFLEGQVLDAFCTYPTGDLVIAPVWAGRMAFPDFTNPQVRDWWSQQYAYLLKIGVDGFWNDMSEPAVLALWGDRSLPKVAQHCLEGRGGDHREVHNLYGLLEAQAAYTSLRQYRPDKRPFIVSRAGWAGLQRYAWTWTGDSISTWQALHLTVSMVIGLGLSGIPYSGPDIGGFKGNPSPELYLRWFQMSTFLVFYRTHSSNNNLPRTPWTFGEPYLSIIRSFLQLRYQLIPYLYTLVWEATQTGHPPVRPLFWYDWTARSLWDVDDAFFLGDALLVCPVIEEGRRSRSVMLPEGGWYNFWTDHQFEGGKTVQLDAPLEQIPVFVKAGSILPMKQEQQLILHLYPLANGECERLVYSDAGDGYGTSRCDRFRLSYQEKQLELTWEQQGDYEFPYQNIQLQIHGVEVRQAWIDGQAVDIQGQRIQHRYFKQVKLKRD